MSETVDERSPLPQDNRPEPAELSEDLLEDVAGGNLVSTYPAHEYDFVPNRLVPPKPSKQDD
jgi:hypothetical protein